VHDFSQGKMMITRDQFKQKLTPGDSNRSVGDYEYLTTKEVAQLLRLKPRTLKKWRSQKQGPPFVRLGNRVRYPRKPLDEWTSRKIVI
jgi:excisionase family DNA binding protein